MFRLALVLTAALASAPSMAAVLTGPIVNPANSNSYYLLDTASWTDSQAEAVSLGGNLVTIDDAQENQWVLDTFAPASEPKALWIGLNDIAVEGTFAWVSGASVNYTNWETGQPNATTPSTDAVFMYGNGVPNRPAGFWNDAQLTDTLTGTPVSIFGVVEVQIPEPGSFALALSAIAAMAIRRRLSSF